MKLRVALFGLLGLVAFLFLGIKAANLAAFENRKTYRLSARFADLGSLKPRAPVRSAGVTVGRVTAIAFDPVESRLKPCETSLPT